MDFNFKQFRLERLLSRKDFAELLDAAIASVYNWEVGKSEISLKKRRKFKEVFGFDPLTERENNDG